MHTPFDAVCFGETLWDVLPAGAVPGGAPMNVAYHLLKLGEQATLITRTGCDKEGEGLRQLFSAQGGVTRFFQEDEKIPTGMVFARPGPDHEVVYDIVFPSAWDFIGWEEQLAPLMQSAGYFIFGSLAARHEQSRATLLRLLAMAPYKILDINLRAPHYTRALLEELLQLTDFLKLNETELNLVAGWYHYNGTTEEKIAALSHHFSIPRMAVTCGANGAFLYIDGQLCMHPGFRVAVKDTIGSGDAFLAGLLVQLKSGAGGESALRYANALGALVASKTGACPDYSLEEIKQLMEGEN